MFHNTKSLKKCLSELGQPNPVVFQWNSIPQRPGESGPGIIAALLLHIWVQDALQFLDFHCQKCLNNEIITTLSEGLIT